ncbi:MAG: ABC transporter permease [bacterium]|nr:ABC transporter permease [bacterium]
MSIKRIYAIFIRQMFLLRHNPARLVNIFLWMAIDIVLWGFITRYLDGLNGFDFSFANVLFGAIILWGFLIRIQQGVMVAFFEDVWSQNFINYFASPLTISEYISGLVISSIFSGILGFTFNLALAGLAFGFNIFNLGLSLLPFLLVLFVFGVALGVFTAAVVLRLGPSAEWIAWPLTAILSPLAAVFYPVSALPGALQIVAHGLPPAYVFESMRAIVISGAPLYGQLSSLAGGFGLAVIYLAAAYFFFIYIYRLVLRRGLITRFSAETSS